MKAQSWLRIKLSLKGYKNPQAARHTQKPPGRVEAGVWMHPRPQRGGWAGAPGWGEGEDMSLRDTESGPGCLGFTFMEHAPHTHLSHTAWSQWNDRGHGLSPLSRWTSAREDGRELQVWAGMLKRAQASEPQRPKSAPPGVLSPSQALPEWTAVPTDPSAGAEATARVPRSQVGERGDLSTPKGSQPPWWQPARKRCLCLHPKVFTGDAGREGGVWSSFCFTLSTSRVVCNSPP